MRRNLKYISQSVAMVTLVSLLLTVFQNCNGYSPNNNSSLLTSTDTTCIGYTCNLGQNNLQIAMDEPDGTATTYVTNSYGTVPYQCPGNNSWCISVGGYCEQAGFASSAFTAQLEGPSGSSFPETPLNGTCDSNGRFDVLVQLPSSFAFNTTQSLIIRFYGKDASGHTYANPSETNQLTLQVVTTTN